MEKTKIAIDVIILTFAAFIFRIIEMNWFFKFIIVSIISVCLVFDILILVWKCSFYKYIRISFNNFKTIHRIHPDVYSLECTPNRIVSPNNNDEFPFTLGIIFKGKLDYIRYYIWCLRNKHKDQKRIELENLAEFIEIVEHDIELEKAKATDKLNKAKNDIENIIKNNKK